MAQHAGVYKPRLLPSKWSVRLWVTPLGRAMACFLAEAFFAVLFCVPFTRLSFLVLRFGASHSTGVRHGLISGSCIFRLQSFGLFDFFALWFGLTGLWRAADRGELPGSRSVSIVCLSCCIHVLFL